MIYDASVSKDLFVTGTTLSQKEIICCVIDGEGWRLLSLSLRFIVLTIIHVLAIFVSLFLP